MTKDERIQGLIEANNRNLEKRRALAKALRDVRLCMPIHFDATRAIINEALRENGPE